MDIFIAVILGFFVLSFLFLWVMRIRNNIVYQNRKKAIEMASGYAKSVIYSMPIEKKRRYGYFWDLLHSYPSYDKMWWSFKKWKFEDFYPDFENKCMELFKKIENE